MCRAGGPRCNGEIARRMHSARKNLRHMQKLALNGECTTAELESAYRRLDAAKEAYSVTTKHERELRDKAKSLSEQAEQARAEGDAELAETLEKRAKKYTEKANYVRADRMAHRKDANSDRVSITDPDTGEKVKVSRTTIERAVNAQNALKENGGDATVPGLNGNLERASESWANQGDEQMRSEMRECRSKVASLQREEDQAKVELKDLQEQADKSDNPTQELKDKLKAKRIEIRSMQQERANNARRYNQLLAATEGVKAFRNSGIPKRDDSSHTFKAAAFDTINDKGKKGVGVKVNNSGSVMPDSKGYKPKGMEVVPGSVRGESFVTYHNGRVIDAQVKVNDVYDPKTQQYYTVTSVTGKSALFTSNNAMQGYKPGDLNTNQETSKGRIRSYHMSEPMSSKAQVRKHRNKVMKDLSARPDDANADQSKSAAGLVVKATESNVQTRLKRGNIAHPEVAPQPLYDIDKVAYHKGT